MIVWRPQMSEDTCTKPEVDNTSTDYLAVPSDFGILSYAK